MKTQITFADGAAFDMAAKPRNQIHTLKNDRNWRGFTVTGDYTEISAAFINNAEYRHEWESTLEVDTGQVDAEGNPIYETTIETYTEPLSDYSIAGEIVDHRDGSYTVYMGKKTEMELTQDAFDALVLDILGGGI
jgi:hypothetical protein